MIDNFALAVSHGLMLLAAMLLMRLPDLDDENAPKAGDAEPGRKKKWGTRRAP